MVFHKDPVDTNKHIDNDNLHKLGNIEYRLQGKVWA